MLPGGDWLAHMPRNSPGGFRRQPRVADCMTPELAACVDRTLAAERAGDLVAALEWHRCVPMFRKGRHHSLMARVADLGDDLPDWVWARWIVYQVTRCEDGVTGRAVQERLREMVSGFHGDLLAECYRSHGDPIRVLARVAGESWAYHQLAVYDDGGLQRFVDEFATDRLAQHASLALRWAQVPMGGYELGEGRPGAVLRVRAATGGPWLEVLDLGARACSPTGFVLGRLVPSGIGEGLMFDTPPMGVRADLARSVATLPEGEWWRGVRGAHAGGSTSPTSFLREDYELTTDVLELDLLRFGTERRDLPRVMQQLREGRDEISRAAYRVLDRARRGEVTASDHAYVGAAALNVKAFRDVRRETARSGGSDCWAEWAERVAGPARSRLLVLARVGRSAA